MENFAININFEKKRCHASKPKRQLCQVMVCEIESEYVIHVYALQRTPLVMALDWEE